MAIPDEDFQVPVTEALWFSNNGWVESELLNGSGDRSIGHLKEIADDLQTVQAATRSVLSREATEEEQQTMVDYLVNCKDRRESALRRAAERVTPSPRCARPSRREV